jgi:hypothetical protein
MSFCAIEGDGEGLGLAASSVVLPHAATTNGSTISATTMRMMFRVLIVLLQLFGCPPGLSGSDGAGFAGNSPGGGVPCSTVK